MKKLYIVELNGKNIRTIFSETLLKVGSIIPDEIWIGNKISGGIVTKIFRE